MAKGPPRPPAHSGGKRGSSDLVRLYLQDIGRVDLLSHEEELTLARLVQRREHLLQERRTLAKQSKELQALVDLEHSRQQLASHLGHWPSLQLWSEHQQRSGAEMKEALKAGHAAWARLSALSSGELKQALHQGRRARDRMIQANLRLVVAVAKKYQQRGMELLDLVQEGTLGLERAVEKYDPTRGFRFSTYAYWWIRQGITRAIATQSRPIRLPVHLSERLTAIRKVSLELAHKLGAMPSRKEIAEEMDMPLDELDSLLRQALTTSSLDAPVNGEEGRSFLGELIADQTNSEPLDQVERGIHQEQLGRWLTHLTDQERQVLELRFGLEGEERHTLAEIGRMLEVSRERVRQVELKALRKLRHLTRRLPTAI